MCAAYLMAVVLSAQDPLPPTPQCDEVFYCYDRVAARLIDLERQVASVESKPKANGVQRIQFVVLRQTKDRRELIEAESAFPARCWDCPRRSG
jgi:hypothetical protein